jgi:hypothetical protein
MQVMRLKAEGTAACIGIFAIKLYHRAKIFFPYDLPPDLHGTASGILEGMALLKS